MDGKLAAAMFGPFYWTVQDVDVLYVLLTEENYIYRILSLVFLQILLYILCKH